MRPEATKTRNSRNSCHGIKMQHVSKMLVYTLWGVRSVVMLCKTFWTCSTGHWTDTVAIVQPNCEWNLQKKRKQYIKTERTPQSVFYIAYTVIDMCQKAEYTACEYWKESKQTCRAWGFAPSRRDSEGWPRGPRASDSASSPACGQSSGPRTTPSPRSPTF